MKTLEKILNVLAANLGYTIVLVAAIILFAIFSDGLLRGLITAASAVVAFTCIELLYHEYAKPKPAASKPAAAKPAKKTKTVKKK